MTGKYNPDNGKIYFTAGDHGDGYFSNGVGAIGSYRQETYSLDLNAKLINPTNPLAGMALEYPYCGPRNQPQPKFPDYVGWTWDPNRHVFWLVPGEFVFANATPCPGETPDYNETPPQFYTAGRLYNFNPSTRTWSLVGINAPDPAQNWDAVYDPVTDKLFNFNYNGGSGAFAQIYNIKTQTWSKTGSLPTFRVGSGTLAVDWVARNIYTIDGWSKTLLAFNMDTLAAKIVSTKVPGIDDSRNVPDISPQIIWDPVNKLLYYGINNYGGSVAQFYAWNPQTDTWTSLSVTPYNEPSIRVILSTLFYDPVLQVIGAFGVGNYEGAQFDPGRTRIFFFSTGTPAELSAASVASSNTNTNTTPQVTTQPIVPSFPSTLKAAFLGITGEDKVGRINQTTANGNADFHISVSGLRGLPSKVTITSNSGGVWEAPFNGTNWIIATQYDNQGNGHYWFEPDGSKNFHVKVTYSDMSIDEVDAVNQVAAPPTSPSAFKAFYLGITGEDKVGQLNQTRPNGKADFHISVSGLRSTPQKITITSDTGGIWETPFNGRNWIIAVQHDQAGNGDYWFEQFGSKTFHVKVYYSDGTSDESDALNQSSSFPAIGIPPTATSFPSTLLAVFAGVDRDTVGQTSVSPDGQADSRIHLTGLRSSPTTVSITSDTGSVWNFPYDGSHWLIGLSNYSAGNADLFFAQWPSNKYHVYVGYSDGTSDETDASFASTLKATFAGTASDLVGKTSLTADGQNDFQLKLTGLRSRPNKVQLTSDSGGMWNFPYDGSHWVVGIYNYTGGNTDLYFTQLASKQVHIAVGYADGTSDEADAVISSVTTSNPTTVANDTRNTATTTLTASSSSGPATVAAVSDDVTVTLQDGLNGYRGTQDAHIYQYHHWLNFGSDNVLKFGEGGQYSVLLRYAIFQSEGGPVPDGATIKSAVLSLYKRSSYDYTFRAHRVLKNWAENSASWDSASSTTNWSIGGALGSDTDIVSTADGQGAVGWDPGWLAIDITSGLQAMSDGIPNYGWRLLGVSGNDNLIQFISRNDSADSTFRPKLTIVYYNPATLIQNAQNGN